MTVVVEDWNALNGPQQAIASVLIVLRNRGPGFRDGLCLEDCRGVEQGRTNREYPERPKDESTR